MAETLYPPTAAGALAERIRAHPDVPTPQVVWLASPGSVPAPLSTAPNAPAPHATSPSAWSGAAAPPLPPTATLPTPAAQGLALPLASRQEPQAGKVVLGLGLPGITRRQEAGRASLKAEAPVQYVTASVTTPVNSLKVARGRHPVPLSSFGSTVSDRGSGPAGSIDSSVAGHLPKWARPTSASSSGQYPSVQSFPPGPPLGSMEMAPTNSCPPSGASSLDSFTVQHSSAKHEPMGIHDSTGSFKWVPQRVFVQSWHHKLSHSYKDYNMVNTVGEGRHGAVFIVQHRRSEKYYACKLLNKAEHNPETLRSEIEMLRKLDHPNIVRLYETTEDKEAVFLLMELCQGGDLFGRITEEGHLSEKVSRVFARQMLDALAYCHAMGVVHRDVKPENFLLETEDAECRTLKLADFGIATSMRCPKTLADGQWQSHVEADFDGGQVHGTCPYMAPEALMRRWSSFVKESKGSPEILGAMDLWSCGVVIYVMLSGDLPYGDSVEAICSGDPPDFSSEVWRSVSPEAIDLIRKLMEPDVRARWTAQQALRHDWFGPAEDEENMQLDISDAAWGLPENRFELGRRLLRLLRRWIRQPKLRRIVIAAMAKRLEADHSSMRFANTVHRSFSRSGEKLTCEQLVRALNDALCDGAAGSAASFSEDQLGGNSARSNDSLASGSSSFSSPNQRDKQSLTGLHVRQKMKTMMRRLSRVSEDTPKGTSPNSVAQQSPGLASVDSEDLVSLTELELLAAKLDGTGNGIVDYTLLVAAVLLPDVYCEDARMEEAFEQFDVRKKGAITAEDLQTVLRGGMRTKDSNNVRQFADMVSEFDLNSDGSLDIAEFRAMLRAGVRDGAGDGGELSATPMTDPTPCTSRASPGRDIMLLGPAVHVTLTPGGRSVPTASPPGGSGNAAAYACVL